MFRLFNSKLLLSAQNTSSYVNCAEEKLSEAMKLKRASTVNKGLTAANLRCCGVGRLVLLAVQTACYSCNHGDVVPLSFLPSDRENCSTRCRRDRVSAGNSLEHSLLLLTSERKVKQRLYLNYLIHE
ncbi:hypothetical protein CHARACLAT_029788 [Characodon lateralis]|uniref:Uncharacterized protein n=1 Tax=Characodon lateralis TaxID=208331 RepID=A0ABU7DMS6_9TELE|nr:hypothetical protein [Characodon lateralis]